MAAPKPFRGSDLRKQVRITGFDLTPDGRHAVYARQTIERDRYRSRLWRVPTTGGRPEQLTNADASDSRPRVSPEGTRLVFLSDRTEKTQAWILPLDGGGPALIEGFPDGGAPAGAASAVPPPAPRPIRRRAGSPRRTGASTGPGSSTSSRRCGSSARP